MNMRNKSNGFTLVEMAIVLVIIAFLIGGVLTPLSTQKEQERRTENQALLDEALEALIGFAIVNKQLPCPDIIGNDGVADACATNSDTYYTGRLPWVTLGINAEFDPWGDNHFVHYTVNGAFVGYTFPAGIDLTTQGTTNGILWIHSSAADCRTPVNQVAFNPPAIIWTSAKNDFTPNADEAENANTDDCYVSRQYSTIANQEFDDQMVWLSPNVLFNRMVSAGKLP